MATELCHRRFVEISVEENPDGLNVEEMFNSDIIIS